MIVGVTDLASGWLSVRRKVDFRLDEWLLFGNEMAHIKFVSAVAVDGSWSSNLELNGNSSEHFVSIVDG